MSRYIDADAIISFVDSGHLRNPLELAWSDNDVVGMIESRPTVDAVPVIHAKWVQNPYSDEPPTCSHCGFESSYYYDRSKSVIENRNGVLLSEAKSKYCPNCGAKMDGSDGERRSDEDQHIYD